MAKEEALATLEKVLSELTNQMKNAYSRSDASGWAFSNGRMSF